MSDNTEVESSSVMTEVSSMNEIPFTEKDKTVPAIFDLTKNVDYIALTSYSWCEEEWKVKIYLDFSGADKINEDNMWLNCNVDELDLKIHHEGKFYRFFIDALFDRVSSCVVKKKSDKFILTLKKQRERIWYKIKYD